MNVQMDVERVGKLLEEVAARLVSHLCKPSMGGLGGERGMSVKERVEETNKAIALAEEFIRALEETVAKVRGEIDEARERLLKIIARPQTSPVQ